MILCIEPDDETRRHLEAQFEEAGFTAATAGSIGEARTRFDDGDPIEGLVTANDLPVGSGLAPIEEVRETVPDTTCVLFTAQPLSEIDTERFGDAVAEYLDKGDPNAYEEVVGLIEHGLAFQSQTAYPLPDDEDARIAALNR